MKILILGSSGFVGSNLIRHFVDKNPYYEIVALDKVKNKNLEYYCSFAKISFVQGSVNDIHLLNELTLGQDLIINLAAQTSHTLPMKDPFIDARTNVEGNLCVLEAIRNYNPSCRYIYVSTSSVVGKALNHTIDESHPKLALDLYSVSKGAAESYCFAYAQSYSLNILTIRFPNLYGPFGHNDPSFGFVNYFLNQAFDRKQLTIFGNGEQKRNILFIDDAINCLKQCFEAPSLYDGTPVFAASRSHHTVKEIAHVIRDSFNSPPIKFIDWPEERKSIEIGDVNISSSKLESLISWDPKYNLFSGIKESALRMHSHMNRTLGEDK